MSIMTLSIAVAVTIASWGCFGPFGSSRAANWPRRRPLRPAPAASPEPDMRHAREILARLHELTNAVAADVGQHNSQMQQINQELIAASGGDPEAVVAVVAKLVQANSRMQKAWPRRRANSRNRPSSSKCRRSKSAPTR